MNKANIEATITRSAVESSQISEVGYDAATETLEIKFKSGGVYRYSGVPQSVAGEMLSAPSVGSYFYKNIKPNAVKYPYAKVS